MMKKIIIVAIIMAGIFALIASVSSHAARLTKEQLIADVRQFGNTVESVHPDPYHKIGGRVEFHRRLQSIIRQIPETGMTVEDFYFLLCPFVTGIGDSHTWLRSPEEFSYGLPLYFRDYSGGLFVAGVPSEEFRPLLGARLIGIEGISFEEIVERAGDFVSAENEFQILRNLGGSGMLLDKWWLDRLIPTCRGQSNINVTLLQKDGIEVRQALECGKYTDFNSYVGLTSRFKLPSRKRSDFVCDFIDSSQQTMLLVIDDLNTYREAFEMWKDEGRFGDCRNDAADLYRRYNGVDPPQDDDSLIAGLPSATRLFSEMARKMKQAGTRTLIVDLRRNEGGNSAMAEILTYFLYGKERLMSIEARQFEVLRCSPLYLERHPGVNLQDFRQSQRMAIDAEDYVFDPWGYPESLPDSQEVRTRFEGWAKSMPTFYAEFLSGEHSRYYLPEKVFVLSSANTFSSGYTVLYYLNQAGAKVVGVASAQAGNCYGDVMDFELENSGLYFMVPTKYFVKFPNEPDKGKALIPDYPLTYEILATYDFDLNASLLYALDLARRP